MTVHRFFVDPSSIKFGKVYFNKDNSKQITKVLRLRKGDSVIVLDGSGIELEVELEQMISDAVSGKIIKERLNNSEHKTFIYLYQALIPKDKFEVVLQKGTEIGISEFIPVETKRSLVKVGDLKPEKFDRFQRIIQEASEQSERGIIPQLASAIKFEDAIIKALNKGLVIVAWEREQDLNLKKITDDLQNNDHISIFVGPEGGFEEKEIEYAREKGAKTISLGSRILRTETAGLVFAANIIFAKED